MTDSERAKAKHEILVHRFAYYVRTRPLIADREYDKLERDYVTACEDDGVDDDLGVGSDISDSYPEEVRDDADARITAR